MPPRRLHSKGALSSFTGVCLAYDQNALCPVIASYLLEDLDAKVNFCDSTKEVVGFFDER